MTPISQIFNNSVWSILSNVHTSLPGIIVSFDPVSNKASVQPALNKKFDTGEMPMPILENVPIIFPSSGNFSMTFPINVGDYVLLIFSERSIDLWKSVGGQVTPNDPRKFSLSDAIAIPGLMPLTENSTNDNQDFVIKFADSEVRISQNGDIQIKTSNKIAIGNEVVELLQQISDTLAGIANITITVPPGTEPPTPFPINNIATFIGIQSQIDSIKGLIT